LFERYLLFEEKKGEKKKQKLEKTKRRKEEITSEVKLRLIEFELVSNLTKYCLKDLYI